MKILLNLDFLKSANKLPDNIQNKLAKLLELVQAEPFHPSLHTKHLSGELAGFLSLQDYSRLAGYFLFLGSKNHPPD